MTTQATTDHPPGATLHLGGDAWAHPALEQRLVPIEEAVPYPGNPRRGDQEAITSSIRELGMYAGCVLQRSTGHILVGNHRRHGAADLGATMVPVDYLDVDDTRAAAIVARDNLTSDRGGYDREAHLSLLRALDAEDALPLSGYSADDLAALSRDPSPDYVPPGQNPSLADRFVVPPFTVLDQRAGAWQERKRRWLSLGIQSEVGRGEPLAGLRSATESQQGRAQGSTKPGTAGRTLAQGLNAKRGPDGGLVYEAMESTAGVSIFDPVLCELAYRWFSPHGGVVLDPFAGGSVRGIVAALLARRYVGVELRGEQVRANEDQRARIVPHLTTDAPTWHTGDSLEVLPTLDVQADLVFSCPPYADLEVYSDDPADLSAMPYDRFLEAYRAIIAAAVARLRPDRFAVWVVGEVRDRRGEYRGLVPDTVRAFTDAGAAFYNEAILVSPVGSLPIRAGRQFAAGRKMGKTHQNVLVFCKGDPRAATAACGDVEVVWPETQEVPDGD